MIKAAVFVLAAAFAGDLNSLDAFFTKDDFAASFQNGDRFEYESKSCISFKCDIVNYSYDVEAMTGDSATVVTRQSDGGEVSRTQVDAQSWEQLAHNRVRVDINNLISYGYAVKSFDMQNSSRSVLINGELRTIETRIVTAVMGNAINASQKLSWEVASGVGGVAQILSSSRDSGFGVDSTDVKSVIHASRKSGHVSPEIRE